MNTLLKVALIGFVCSVFLISRVHAQLQVNPVGGYTAFAEKGSSFGDGKWGGGVAVRYFMKPRIAVGINGRYFGKSNTYYFGTELVKSSTSLLHLTGEVDYFLTQTKFRSYIGIESGLYSDRSTTETSGRPKTYNTGNYVGGAPKIGVQYSVTSTIGLALDAGCHFIVDGNTPSKSVLLNAGVFFVLGTR